MAVRTAAEAKTAAYILYDKSQNGDIVVEGELRLGFVGVLLVQFTRFRSKAVYIWQLCEVPLRIKV